MLKVAQSVTEHRKPRLGRCHIGASASGSGCTAPWRCGRDPVPFCSTFEVPRSTSGWGQHFVLVRALLGSADRMVGGQVYAP